VLRRGTKDNNIFGRSIEIAVRFQVVNHISFNMLCAAYCEISLVARSWPLLYACRYGTFLSAKVLLCWSVLEKCMWCNVVISGVPEKGTPKRYRDTRIRKTSFVFKAERSPKH
jgi:hypothetical protein